MAPTSDTCKAVKTVPPRIAWVAIQDRSPGMKAKITSRIVRSAKRRSTSVKDGRAVSTSPS